MFKFTMNSRNTGIYLLVDCIGRLCDTIDLNSQARPQGLNGTPTGAIRGQLDRVKKGLQLVYFFFFLPSSDSRAVFAAINSNMSSICFLFR